MTRKFSRGFESTIIVIVILSILAIFLFFKMFCKSKNEYESIHLVKRSEDHGDIKWYCAEVNKLGHDFALTEEEYRVYSALLDQYGFINKRDIYIIETVSRKCGEIEKEYKLENKFKDSKISVKIVSEEEGVLYQREKRKDADSELSLDEELIGLLRFSRVGFNQDKTRAVVDIDYHCGLLCGESADKVFNKIGDKWKLTNAGVYLDDNTVSNGTIY